MNSSTFVKNKEGLYRLRGAVAADDIVKQAAAILLEGVLEGKPLNSAREVENFLHLALGNKPNETFSTIFLNNRHQVIAFEDLFMGTINSAAVHPRVVAQRALQLNAGAVIVAHNHPSNDPDPSKADIFITEKLQEALAILDIRLLDHFIVTRNECISMAERGLM